MNTAKAFGAALFDAVFSADVKACFRSSIDEVRRQNAGCGSACASGSERGRSPLGIPLQPFGESVHRALDSHAARQIHGSPERIQPIAVKPPIRVLVMISSPSDFPALDVEAEWTRLNEALGGSGSAGQLAIDRLETASLEALQHRLRRERYHIFHFIGHGEFDQERQEGVLILEGDKRGHMVERPVARHDAARPRIASGRDPQCLRGREHVADRSVRRLRASLVQQGIPAVIAMQFEIADDVASRFAHDSTARWRTGIRLTRRSPRPASRSLPRATRSMGHAGPLPSRARRPHLRHRHRRPAEAALGRRERAAGRRLVDADDAGADHR